MPEQFEEKNTEQQETQEVLRRLNRGLRMMIECSQAMAHAMDEVVLMQEVCRIIVKTGGYSFAWVGLGVNDETKNVRPVAQYGLEDDYLKTINITWADTERGRGPTGTAIRTNKPFVSRNIMEDLRFALWRDEAVKRGFKAVIGIPISLGDGVNGALNIYSAELDVFDTEEVKLLMELGRDLSFGLKAIRQRIALQRSEEALEQSLHHIKVAVETAKIGIWYVDPATSLVTTVQGGGPISGLPEGTYPKKKEDFLALVHPEDRSFVDERISLALEGKKDYSIEFRSIWPDGSIHWIYANARVIRDVSGKPTAMIGADMDITERKKAEQKFKEECSFSGSIINNTAEGIAVCHEIAEYPHVRFTVWNKRMEQITGYVMEEINRLGWYQTVYPDPALQKAAKERMSRMRQGDNLAAEQWEITRKDGQKRTISISTSIVTSADKVVHVLALMADVTERVKTEKALEESEERYRLVAQNMMDYIWVLDTKLKYTYISPSVTRMRGYTPEELIKLPLRETMSPDSFRLVTKVFEEEIGKEKTQPRDLSRSRKIELELKRKDGSWMWAEINMSFLRDAHGTPIGIMGVTRDISDRKKSS